jgi:hypothetical protein
MNPHFLETKTRQKIIQDIIRSAIINIEHAQDRVVGVTEHTEAIRELHWAQEKLGTAIVRLAEMQKYGFE